MSATETTTSLPKWQLLVSAGAMVGTVVATIFIAIDWWGDYVEKRELIDQSNYSMDIDDGALILTSTDRSMIPTKVIVTPIFDTPVSEMGMSEGIPNEPYGDLSPHSSSPDGKIKIVIPGVVREVCEKTMVDDPLCKKNYAISEFEVEIYFGDHLVPPDYVPNS